MLHALCLKLFYRFGLDSCLEVEAKSVLFGPQVEGLGDMPYATAIDARHGTWAAQLPRDTADLWDKRLAEALKQQPASNVLEFFPKAADRYRQKVADIHAALSRGEEGDREAIALVRSLIGRVVVHATPTPEPLGLEVEGSLAALMSDAPELEHSDISCCMPPQPLLL
jgi:hypothetical protein